MVSLEKIKNNLNDTISNLSPNKKAELYYKNRKRFIKLGLDGERNKALELLKKNDEFYREHYQEDPDLFHKAHHKFLDWYSDYQYFMQHRELLISAKRDQSYLAGDMNLIIYIKQYIESYLKTEDKKQLTILLKMLKERENSTFRELLEMNDVIQDIMVQIESNQFYKKHDYFQDVDPLRFRDLSLESYFNVRGNSWSNNGPEKINRGEITSKNHD